MAREKVEIQMKMWESGKEKATKGLDIVGWKLKLRGSRKLPEQGCV